MRSPYVASVVACLLCSPAVALAADPPPAAPDDAAARKKLEEEIARELGQGGVAPAPAPAASPQAGQAPAGPVQGTTGGNPLARVLLLPDISAIGSFAAAYDSYDVGARSPRGSPYAQKGQPAFRFEELELGLQSVVDPYARADAFISFTPEGVDVEEAYLTTLSLPAGLQLKAGKFFSPFGRLNQQHPHIWDFVDAPLAAQRVLATDVLSGPGVDLAWLTPLPWYTELHGAGQNTAPEGQPDDRLTGLARLVTYVPVSDGTTVGLGVSAVRRSERAGAFRDVGGVDLYVRSRPIATRSYVTLQGELYGRKFRNVNDGATAGGGYAQLFWRQDAYFGYGVRYDNAPAAGEAAPGREHRLGGVGIWYPSEFQRLRLQVSWDRTPGDRSGLEALLALEFGIGAHGAHPF